MPSPVGALTKIKKMHSPLEKAVAAHKLESMPSAQWAAYIKANAPKSAKKEALAVKLDELLARQPKVTKAEIVQHIKDNSPKIKTKLLKDKPYTAGDIDSHVNIEPNGSGGYRYIDDNGDVVHESWGTDAMVDYLNSTQGAKYGEHTLPGGQNYQEMLLSLPRNQSQAIIRNQKVYEIKDANGQLLATGQLPMSPRTQAKLNNNPDWVVREFEQPNPNDLRRDPANFQSGHYDDPNILAHMRMNDRPTAEGKKALFLEELQSDWAQQGRKEGFDTGVSIKYDPGVDAYRAYDTKGNMINLRVGNESFSAMNSEQAVRDALANSKFSKGIPRAPYVEDTGDWTGLGLKKAIEHAVEQGHDSIAWTTGAQQADRYSLSKQIDRIDHNLNDDGTYSFSAIKDGKEVIAKEGLTQDELADHLGKDVAEKIVKGEGTAPASVDRWEAEPSIYGEAEAEAPPPYRSLSGLDLEVGGEGMKGYYDQIVPQTANDILKSMGVTERVKPIGIGKELASPHAGTNYEIRDSAGDLWNTHRNAEDAQQYVDQQMSNPAFIEKGLTLSVNPIEPKYRPTSIQQGFDITPEIRDYVLNQGLPAFAGGGIVKAVGKGLRGMAEKYRLAHEAAQKNAVKMLGLPPNNTAMDRAKALGFNTERTLYHGTDANDFNKFNSMSFFSNNPKEASAYAQVSDLVKKEKALKKYNINPKVINVKKEVPYSGILSDILTPKVGKLYATDNGVFKYRGNDQWDAMSKLDVDYEKSKNTDLAFLKKSDNSEALNTVLEYNQYINDTFPGGVGGRVIPVITSAKNPVEMSAMNANVLGKRLGATDKDIQDTISKYTDLGFDSIKTTSDEATFYPEVRDALGGIPEQEVIFNPSQLRSPFAAFDPMRRNENDILAGVGVGLPVSGLVDKQEPIKKAEGGDVDYDELYEFKDYGNRETGEAKDTGALGEIRMPNGRDVMTEYSINVDGREMPSIVEGMHPADVNYIRETGSVPQDAVATAVRSANKREASGQSPFWNRKDTPAFAHGGEVDYDKHYEFIQPAFAHGGEVDYDSMYEFR